MTNPRISLSWHEGAPPPELHEADLIAAVESFLETLGHGQGGVNLLLADDAVLRELNRRHRKLDAPTDVLSWSYLEDGAGAELLGAESPGEGLLGEIALSLDRSRAQAAEFGWNLRTEVLRLLAHGCAHLAGHDHQTAAGDREMRSVEIGMLDRVGVKNLYPPG